MHKWLTRGNLWVFFGLVALQLSWALAMPITSGPDEPAHVYRAVSLWSGQFMPADQAPSGGWWVRVPSSVREYAESTACVRLAPEATASCPKSTHTLSGPRTAEVVSGAGRYLPFYYYAVGWPARLSTGVPGFYLMRLISLLVSSLLLTAAVSTLMKSVHRSWAGLSLAVALTPQLLWVNSLVNPNSWEIDAALLAWAAGLAAVSGRSSERRTVLATKFMAGCVLLLLTRRLSPLWLVMIVIALIAVWSCLPAAMRNRPRATRAGVISATVLTLLAFTSAWWHVTFDLAPVNSAQTMSFYTGSFIGRFGAAFPFLKQWFRQTYGVFGWLDTRSPAAAMAVWLVGGILLATLAIRQSQLTRRMVLTLGAGLFLCAAVPMLFEVAFGPKIGMNFWQGRYTMPFSQGIPLALGILGSAWAANAKAPKIKRLSSRLMTPATWLLWTFSVLTFVSALHRFTSGFHGGWRLSSIHWTPPGGISLIITLHILGTVIFARETTRYGGIVDTEGPAQKIDVASDDTRDLRTTERRPVFSGEPG